MISNFVDQYIYILLDEISKQHSIDKNKLLNTKKNVEQNFIIKYEHSVGSTVQHIQHINVLNKGKCAYIIQKGKKKGTYCVFNSSRNKKYCSRHSNLFHDDEKNIKSTPQSSPYFEESKKELIIHKIKSGLYKNKIIGKFVDKKTNYVFEKINNQYKVVGKNNNDKLIKLKLSDILDIKKNGFIIEEQIEKCLKYNEKKITEVNASELDNSDDSDEDDDEDDYDSDELN